jgi:hypothetical protein
MQSCDGMRKDEDEDEDEDEPEPEPEDELLLPPPLLSEGGG